MSIQAPGVKTGSKISSCCLKMGREKLTLTKWYLSRPVEHLFIISCCKVSIKFSFSLSDLVWTMVTITANSQYFPVRCLRQTWRPSLCLNAGSVVRLTRVTSSELASLQSLVASRFSREKKDYFRSRLYYQLLKTGHFKQPSGLR